MAKQRNTNGTGASLGFEAELFKAADKLRGNMEPSDYKHVALWVIFLKHISDSFEARRAALLDEYPEGAEDPDEYAAENVFSMLIKRILKRYDYPPDMQDDAVKNVLAQAEALSARWVG